MLNVCLDVGRLNNDIELVYAIITLLHGDPLFSIYQMQLHRDTEKADGMLDTIFVQLPSDYNGGVLHVCHCVEEMGLNFSLLKGTVKFHYTTFCADCQHKLCNVTRGYWMSCL